MSIYVIFTCKSQPDKLDALTKILNQAKIDFPNNVKGCEAFRVFNDVNDPCAFTLVETWASETDHKKNIESMVASGVWGHIASHLACDPASSYFKEL
jgi:quinol monooxygenase YgiN